MKKKILVGYIMDGTSGGIDRYLLRFIEQVWEEDIQIDFLSDRSAYELKKRLEKYKSRVFQVSSLWHPVTQYRQTQKIIQENGYDVVYLNISTAMDFIGAKAAKDAGVKEVILHSHSGVKDCCMTYCTKSAEPFYSVSEHGIMPVRNQRDTGCIPNES